MENGGYVFISHSHQDIEKVRKIRNRMEEAGYEPLCFYLKCLSDNDEIEDLIKREISAREWFVYADSPNARASAWVKKERDYINSLGSKQTVTIDLEKEGSMDDIAQKLCKGLRVFLAYSLKDIDIVRKLAESLKKLDMQVFTDEEMKPGDDWAEVNERNLSNCERSGGIIPVISSNSLKSSFVQQEIDHAAAHGAVIIPVLIDGAKPLSSMNAVHSISLKRDSSALEYDQAAVLIAEAMGTNLRDLFHNARSHQDITNLYWSALKGENREALEALKEEADDRLEDQRREREDIENALEAGTLKMTDQLRRYLDSLY